MKHFHFLRTLPLMLLLLLVCTGCARPDGLVKWAQSLKAEDVTAAYIWCYSSKEPERGGELSLTQEQIEAVVAQINTITEDQLTWNKELAGITPEYGLRLICGEKEYNINHADAPGGGLETHWKNAQWWIENPALEELLIDLSGWPGYPEYSSAG